MTIKKNSSSNSLQETSGLVQATKDGIDVTFYAMQRLPKLFSSVIGIVGLMWFGSACFKLGWFARDNFILRPIAEVMMGLEVKEAEKTPWFDFLD